MTKKFELYGRAAISIVFVSLFAVSGCGVTYKPQELTPSLLSYGHVGESDLNVAIDVVPLDFVGVRRANADGYVPRVVPDALQASPEIRNSSRFMDLLQATGLEQAEPAYQFSAAAKVESLNASSFILPPALRSTNIEPLETAAPYIPTSLSDGLLEQMQIETAALSVALRKREEKLQASAATLDPRLLDEQLIFDARNASEALNEALTTVASRSRIPNAGYDPALLLAANNASADVLRKIAMLNESRAELPTASAFPALQEDLIKEVNETSLRVFSSLEELANRNLPDLSGYAAKPLNESLIAEISRVSSQLNTALTRLAAEKTAPLLPTPPNDELIREAEAKSDFVSSELQYLAQRQLPELSDIGDLDGQLISNAMSASSTLMQAVSDLKTQSYSDLASQINGSLLTEAESASNSLTSVLSDLSVAPLSDAADGIGIVPLNLPMLQMAQNAATRLSNALTGIQNSSSGQNATDMRLITQANQSSSLLANSLQSLDDRYEERYLESNGQPRTPTPKPVSDIPLPSIKTPQYRIGAGDVIAFTLDSEGLALENELASQRFIVERSGEIEAPRVGRLEIAGLTIDEARRKISERFLGIGSTFVPSISIIEFGSQRVSVNGLTGNEVVPLGIRPLTIGEAITSAGGLGDDPGNIIVRVLRNGQNYTMRGDSIISSGISDRILLDGDVVSIDFIEDIEELRNSARFEMELEQFRRASENLQADANRIREQDQRLREQDQLNLEKANTAESRERVLFDIALGQYRRDAVRMRQAAQQLQIDAENEAMRLRQTDTEELRNRIRFQVEMEKYRSEIAQLLRETELEAVDLQLQNANEARNRLRFEIELDQHRIRDEQLRLEAKKILEQAERDRLDLRQIGAQEARERVRFQIELDRYKQEAENLKQEVSRLRREAERDDLNLRQATVAETRDRLNFDLALKRYEAEVNAGIERAQAAALSVSEAIANEARNRTRFEIELDGYRQGQRELANSADDRLVSLRIDSAEEARRRVAFQIELENYRLRAERLRRESELEALTNKQAADEKSEIARLANIAARQDHLDRIRLLKIENRNEARSIANENRQIILANIAERNRERAEKKEMIDLILAEEERQSQLRASQRAERRASFNRQLELGMVGQDYVTVAGETITQTVVPIPFGQTITLNRVLYGDAGGVNLLYGDPSEIYVIRLTDRDQERLTAYHLNARNPAALSLASIFEMRPNDVVYVNPQPVTKWYRLLQQIVPATGLLQSGIQAGATL